MVLLLFSDAVLVGELLLVWSSSLLLRAMLLLRFLVDAILGIFLVLSISSCSLRAIIREMKELFIYVEFSFGIEESTEIECNNKLT